METPGERRITVFVASHCLGCPAALRLVERVRARRPHWSIDVVDTDVTEPPPWVIGTPIYARGSLILFWGNPSESELLSSIDSMDRESLACLQDS